MKYNWQNRAPNKLFKCYLDDNDIIPFSQEPKRVSKVSVSRHMFQFLWVFSQLRTLLNPHLYIISITHSPGHVWFCLQPSLCCTVSSCWGSDMSDRQWLPWWRQLHNWYLQQWPMLQCQECPLCYHHFTCHFTSYCNNISQSSIYIKSCKTSQSIK